MQLVSNLLGSGGELTRAGGPQWLYFNTSTVFTPSVDMEVNVHVLGASGTGGAGATTTGGVNASGAGAGGYALKRAKLRAGVSYVITIGAGGAMALAPSGARVNGNDGSPTSFVGGDLNIVANGGKGGVATACNVAAPGGLGGTATGGDKNFPGGRGGNIAANLTLQSTVMRATGGGAMNLFGTGDCNGGDLTYNAYTAAVIQSTGGASCVQSAMSTASTNSVNFEGGLLTLLGVIGTTALTIEGRTIFGLYNTIGPSGNVGGNVGPLGGGAGGNVIGGYYGGSGGSANGSGQAQSNGNGRATPGGAAGSGASAASSDSRQAPNGAVYLELL